MKKTIFALLLLVALVAVLAVPAAADVGTLENHCVCGDMSCDGTPSNGNDQHHWETWSAWNGTGTWPTSGYYYLSQPVELNSSGAQGITPAANSTLGIDLNGFTLSGNTKTIFKLANANSKLILTDSVGTGKVDYSKTTQTYGNGIHVSVNNVVVDMFGGEITGTKTGTSGGTGIVIADGSSTALTDRVVNMYGGKITNGKIDNTAADRGGGNVSIRVKSTFNMFGGEISGGTSNHQGGNIYMQAGAQLNISGSAKISGGDAAYGGNIYVAMGNISFTGGQISGGAASADGGNVYIKSGTSGSQLTVSGGKIFGGTATRGSAVFATNAFVRLEKGVVTSSQDENADVATGIYMNNVSTTRTLNMAGMKKIVLESDVPALKITGTAEVDLNGHTVGTVNIDANKVLNAYDSKTADYTVADGVYGKIAAKTGNGTIARDFVNSDNQRYLVVKKEGVYSSHRIYLAVTQFVLADTADALNYNTVLRCDEVVAGLVGSNYGVQISKGDQVEDLIYYADAVITGENVKATQLSGFLVRESAENATRCNSYYGTKACIKVTDQLAPEGEFITSTAKTTSYAAVIAETRTMDLDPAQREILKNIYLNYNVGGFMDGWWIRRLADANAPTGPLPLSVGFGRVDITPEPGYGLAGMGDEATRLAIGTDTPLYATCIAVTDEYGNTVLLISSDSIRTEPWVTDQMRDTISSQLGVPRTNIISSTTHSHNTPNPNNTSYATIFQNGCLEACRLAMEDRKPAQMYTGTTTSDGLNFVRHYLMSDGSYAGNNYGDWDKTPVAHETEVDNEVQIIKFTRGGGKDIVMMNWRAHPIASSGGNYLKYSAGFIGHCRNEMETTLDCHFAYFQGASGNVADVSEISGEEKFINMADQGEKLAECAIDYMDQLERVETALVEVKTVNYLGNVRVDSQAYIDAANTFKSMIDQGMSTAQAIAAANGLCNSSLAVSGIELRQNAYAAGNGKFTLELATISIGDVAFVSAPYEMFDNSGKQIKEGSPYEQTFILYLSNGRGRYMASEPAYTHGCYEKDHGIFVKGTAEELVSVYVDMLEQTRNDGVVDPTITTFDSRLPNDT